MCNVLFPKEEGKIIVCSESFDNYEFPSEEEFEEYACRIGIDIEAEPHLLPIAKEGLLEPLPKDWVPCYDSQSDRFFYFNIETCSSQWENPLDNIYREIVKKSRSDSIYDQEDNSSLAKDISQVSSLPEDMLPKKLQPLKRQGSTEKLDPLVLPSSDRKSPLAFEPQPFSKGAGTISIPPKSLTLTGGGASFLRKTIQPARQESESDSWTDSNAEEAAKKISVVSTPGKTPTRGILRDGSEMPENEKKSIKFNMKIDEMNYQQQSESDWDSDEPAGNNESDEVNQSKNSDDTDLSITSKFKLFDAESLAPVGGNGDGLLKVSTNSSTTTVSNKTILESEEVEEKRKKEMKEKMNQEREALMEKLRKENASALEKLKKDLQKRFEEERDKLEKQYDDDLDALKESTEAMEMLEVQKMKLEYNKHLEREKQNLGVEHERNMIKMFSELEELQRGERDVIQQQIDMEKKKDEVGKQMQEELRKKKDEIKVNHQKQLEQMKDYFKDSIAKLKKNQEVEEEQMKREFIRRKEDLKKEHKRLEDEVKEEQKRWAEQAKEELKKRKEELTEEKRRWMEEQQGKWEEEKRKWEDEQKVKWEGERKKRGEEMEGEMKRWEGEEKERSKRELEEGLNSYKEELKKNGCKVAGKATKEYLTESSEELKELMEQIQKKRERLLEEKEKVRKQEEEMKNYIEERRKVWEEEGRKVEEEGRRMVREEEGKRKTTSKKRSKTTLNSTSSSPQQDVSHEIKAVLSHEEKRDRDNRSPMTSSEDCKVIFVNQKTGSTPNKFNKEKTFRGKNTDIKYPKQNRKNFNRRSKSYTSLNRNDSLSEDLRHILHSKNRLKKNMQALDTTELSENMPTDSSGFSSTDCTLDWLDSSVRPLRYTQSTPTTTKILSSLKQLNEQVQSLHRVVTTGSQLNVCRQRSCCSNQAPHRAGSWDSIHPTYSYPLFKPSNSTFIERAQELKQWLVPGVSAWPQNNL